jgi:ring-1,2-phenylacetyl-CoA epoxidase subunit PaaD
VSADPRLAAASVVDPEIRALTIDELGILRGVRVDPDTGRVTVTITPTYSGCPAMDVIRSDVVQAVRAAGHPDVVVETVLSPAWSTDMISDSGREKLAAAGIAPPGPAHGSGTGASGSVRLVGLTLTVRCPLCGSPDTEQLSRFGSTACKALWRCRACTQPFEHLKAL